MLFEHFTEYYGVIKQVEEEVLFQISYRSDITTANVVTFRGVDYEIKGAGSARRTQNMFSGIIQMLKL